MRKALIETATGFVKNLIEIEDDAIYEPASGRSVINPIGADGVHAQIGGRWDGTIFLPAPAPLPAPPPRFDAIAIQAEAATTVTGLKAIVAALARAL